MLSLNLLSRAWQQEFAAPNPEDMRCLDGTDNPKRSSSPECQNLHQEMALSPLGMRHSYSWKVLVSYQASDSFLFVASPKIHYLFKLSSEGFSWGYFIQPKGPMYERKTNLKILVKEESLRWKQCEYANTVPQFIFSLNVSHLRTASTCCTSK